MNTRKIGTVYEAKAAEYMRQQGMKVFIMNYRCRQGEIDIVGQEQEYLLFVEVKYRKNTQSGDPAEAVTQVKQERIRRTAEYYLYSHQLPETTKVRFDVAAMTADEIRYIRNAF